MKHVPAMQVPPNSLVLFFARDEDTDGVIIQIDDVDSNERCSEALKVLADVFRLKHEEEQVLPPPPPSAPPLAPMTAAEQAEFDHGFNDYTDDIDIVGSEKP